jgi:hypothetical protein
MEPISISIARLIQDPYLFVDISFFHKLVFAIFRIFCLEKCLESVGDLCLRLSCEPYLSSGIFF